jgi:hypothetical protein
VPLLARAIDDADNAAPLAMHQWLLPWRSLLGKRMAVLDVAAARAVTRVLLLLLLLLVVVVFVLCKLVCV